MERSRTRKMTAGAALIGMGLALYVLQRVEGLNAGALIKEVAAIVGGGGGGRPDMAQAGGTKPEKLDQALDKAYEVIERA